MADLKKEGFTVDGVAIAPPTTYKPVFATTSTKSSKKRPGADDAQQPDGNDWRI